MKYNKKVGVLVKWEYWYRSENDIKNGIQNDPICRKKRVNTIEDAISLIRGLKSCHRENLKVADITLRLFPEGD